MTPDDLEWGDPPERKTMANRVQVFVELLRARPGEWAKYPHPITRETVKNHANRHPKRYPGTEWTHRNGELYGRWIGES